MIDFLHRCFTSLVVQKGHELHDSHLGRNLHSRGSTGLETDEAKKDD